MTHPGNTDTGNPTITASSDRESLSITREQYSLLTGQGIRPETRCGQIGWAHDDGSWISALTRPEGTLAVPIWYVSPFIHIHGNFAARMAAVLRAETYDDVHTQQSLDEAMELCLRLIPDDEGRVDALALCNFFEDDRDFSWLCHHISHAVRACPLEGYHHTVPPFGNSEGIVKPGPKQVFRMNEKLAFRVALSSPTRRGDVLRREYFDLKVTLTSVSDFDLSDYYDRLLLY